MILRRLPRLGALAVVGVVSFVVALLLLPVTMLPAVIEDNLWSGIGGGYGEYLVRVATLAIQGTDAAAVFGAAVAWAAMSVLFLSPIVGRPREDGQGRSLVGSVVAAALIGSLGCAMAGLAAVEATAAVMWASKDEFEAAYEMLVPPMYIGGVMVWIGGGFVWYRLLRRAGSMRDPAGLDRLIRRLFAGTGVELLLGVVFYLQVRRRTSCYCALVSFWNLVLGVLTLLWMCGPWALLLVSRRERTAWGRGACRRCGYPQRSGSAVCTECGAVPDAD